MAVVGDETDSLLAGTGQIQYRQTWTLFQGRTKLLQAVTVSRLQPDLTFGFAHASGHLRACRSCGCGRRGSGLRLGGLRLCRSRRLRAQDVDVALEVCAVFDRNT